MEPIFYPDEIREAHIRRRMRAEYCAKCVSKKCAECGAFMGLPSIADRSFDNDLPSFFGGELNETKTRGIGA